MTDKLKPCFTQDITFCSNRKCENEKCKRNSCHIDWSVKPYQSFANFENTQYCQKNRRAENDRLANGVILPPCKVGDKVYTYGAKRIKEWEITFVGKNSRNEYKFIAVVGKCEDLLTFWNYEIGKTVFLTKEEAETRLKELQNAETKKP